MNPQIAYLLNLSIQQIQSGRLDEAEQSLNRVIRVDPKNADALCFLSVVAAYKLRWQEALRFINESIKIAPKNSIAHSNKGNILKELEQIPGALKSFQKAIELDPKNFEALNNIGNLYLDQGRFADAIASYDLAISLNAKYPEAYSNKGNALHKMSLYEDALVMYGSAIELRPNYVDAWLNRSFSLTALKQYGAAIESCDVAISIDQNNFRALTTKGLVFIEMGLHEQALELFDKSLSINSEYFEAWADRASTLVRLKQYEKALASFENAIKGNESLPYLLGDIISLKLQIGLWDSFDNDLHKIAKGLREKLKVINPFKLLAVKDSLEDVLNATRIWVEDKFPSKNSFIRSEASHKRKIRIGYLSADFKNHPVGLLTAGLFELHNREQFEIYGFSLKKAEQGDQVRNRLEKGFDYFFDLHAESEAECVQIIRNHQLDIAVDLGGHTQYAPTGIMSHRIAPIQVNYLGYPGTMGADYIDYMIADYTVIPQHSQQFYNEKIAYLPDTFMVDDSLRQPSNKVFTRVECNLPEQGFIFCCFNNAYKFNKKVVESWARILKAVDGSVLWLSENNNLFKKNISQEFEKLGISKDRIIFAQRLDSVGDYLARISVADLFLDTHPYNAHTTALDALKSGVPIVTYIGQTFAARVAASLLSSIGLTELICDSIEEYEKTAIALANNSAAINSLKSKLAKNKNTEPLFDTERFVNNIESAYKEMFRKYVNGFHPDHIYLKSYKS